MDTVNSAEPQHGYARPDLRFSMSNTRARSRIASAALSKRAIPASISAPTWESGACSYLEISGSSGHVYSFEPLSRNLDRFRQNVRLSERTNVTVLPTALGKETGKVKIYTPEDPGRTSLAPESAHDSVEEVQLRRLDDVWAELNHPKISFAKMDVEGSEPFVLERQPKSSSARKCKPVVVSKSNTAQTHQSRPEAGRHFRSVSRIGLRNLVDKRTKTGG